MKRGTTPCIPVKILLNNEEIDNIEFIIKKEKTHDADVLIQKCYPLDVDYEDDCYMLELTEEETLSLPSGVVYMDTRIVMNDGKIPNTRIVTIRVDDTLFGESM